MPPDSLTEDEWEARCISQDEASVAFITSGDAVARTDALAGLSHARGVSIRWLVAWTTEHDCWEKPTWQVQRDLIKPHTEGFGRCRYVELPGVVGVVGPAAVFGSHCWGASWGLLVSALADCCIDGDTKCWVDVFAVRQWPGNGADLDFRGVVKRCKGFALVAPSIEGVSKLFGRDVTADEESMERWGLSSEDQENGTIAAVAKLGLTQAERKEIAFFRVWCLVEIAAARDFQVPVIMLCGTVGRRPSPGDFPGLTASAGTAALTTPPLQQQAKGQPKKERCVTPNIQMLQKLAGKGLVDVERAEASVAADRDRILNDIRASPGGAAGLNATVLAAIAGSLVAEACPAIRAVACGDDAARDALLAAVGQQKQQEQGEGGAGKFNGEISGDSVLLAAAGLGLEGLVEELLDTGKWSRHFLNQPLFSHSKFLHSPSNCLIPPFPLLSRESIKAFRTLGHSPVRKASPRSWPPAPQGIREWSKNS